MENIYSSIHPSIRLTDCLFYRSVCLSFYLASVNECLDLKSLFWAVQYLHVFLSVSVQGPYQRTLLKNLLKDYNRMERPVANDSLPLTVFLSMSLIQIMDVVSHSFFFFFAFLCVTEYGVYLVPQGVIFSAFSCPYVAYFYGHIKWCAIYLSNALHTAFWAWLKFDFDLFLYVSVSVSWSSLSFRLTLFSCHHPKWCSLSKIF